MTDASESGHERCDLPSCRICDAMTGEHARLLPPLMEPYDDSGQRAAADLEDETKRLRDRDAAAQTLIGVMRHRLLAHGDEAGGKDFRLYREYQALGLPTAHADEIASR